MRGIPIGSMNLIESFVFPNALPTPPPKFFKKSPVVDTFYETESEILAEILTLNPFDFNRLGITNIFSSYNQPS